MKHKVNISKISLFFAFILAFILFFLINSWLAPSGAWLCRQSFDNKSALNLFSSDCVGKPSPQERYAFSPNGSLLMLADPLYFSVFSPRPFQNIELEIIYRPYLSNSKPIFEAGFLADAKLWRYRLQPVYNQWLEKYLTNWTLVSDGKLKLYQKGDNFKSVREFISYWEKDKPEACQSVNCLALYNVSPNTLKPILNIDSLKIKKTDTIFPYGLRGSHQLYLYLNEDYLKISGTFSDLNENKDLDSLEIVLLDTNEKKVILDIGDKRGEKELSYEESIDYGFNFQEDDLKQGLYKLEIRASDDIVVKNLQINSSYLSVINKIWPISQGPISLKSDTNYLQVKSLSPLSNQRLEFGDKQLDVSEIYKQYEIQNDKGDNIISLERGGLILENSGVFSFDDGDILNPNYPQLDRYSFQNKNLQYILADYSQADSIEGDWRRSTLHFSASDLYRENGHYNLILSIPGLKLNEGVGGLMEIKEIKIKYYGPSLWQKLRSMILRK